MVTKTNNTTSQAPRRFESLQDQLLELLGLPVEPAQPSGRPPKGQRTHHLNRRHGWKRGRRRKPQKHWRAPEKFGPAPRAERVFLSIWGQCPDCLDVFTIDAEIAGQRPDESGTAGNGRIQTWDSRIRQDSKGGQVVLIHRPCRRPFRAFITHRFTPESASLAALMRENPYVSPLEDREVRESDRHA